MASRWARMGRGLLMAFLAVVALVLAFAEASAGGRQYLLVADTAERRIYTYRVPDMVMTGELSNILLSAHMGTFALPDGRILLAHVGTVFLERLTNGPVPGMPAAGTERRFVAITPDGRYAFATHGGDGRISFVDTARLSVEQVTVPTALRGGGYIVAIQRGLHPPDLIAR